MKLALIIAAFAAVACAPGQSTPSQRASFAPSPTTRSAPAFEATPVASQMTYVLTCGPVQLSECEAMAARIVDNALARYPGKTVVSVEITGVDGDHTLLFEDGTGIGADIN